MASQVSGVLAATLSGHWVVLATRFLPVTFSRFYEPIVKKNVDRLLEAPAIVLANLCVSYIMTSLVRAGAPGGGGEGVTTGGKCMIEVSLG